MSLKPIEINSGILATNALDIMNKNKITQLVVVDNGMYTGLIHLHNIIKEGLV
jgi:arabinose-5-phosphate isomerase